MCKHENTKGFKFCPYCGEKLPKIEITAPAVTEPPKLLVTIDAFDPGIVRSHFVDPIVSLDTKETIFKSERKAQVKAVSGYLEKCIADESYSYLNCFIRVCEIIESNQVPFIKDTTSFAYRDLANATPRPIPAANSLVAAGILYSVGKVNYGTVTDTCQKQTYDDIVNIYQYNPDAKTHLRVLLNDRLHEIKYEQNELSKEKDRICKILH